VAQTGLQFDLRTAQGKLIASLMAALAEFERDLLREQRSFGYCGCPQAVVFVFGPTSGAARQGGPLRVQSLETSRRRPILQGISHRLGLSKNTILEHRQARPRCLGGLLFYEVCAVTVAGFILQ